MPFGLLDFFVFFVFVIGDSDQECVHNFFFKEIFTYLAVLGCCLWDLWSLLGYTRDSHSGSAVENLPAMQEVLETLV